MARLPFRVLYFLSEGLVFVLYHLFGYRKEIVHSQLKACFPDWTDQKIKEVALDSYRNLADIMMESFKTDRLSKEEMKERYKFTNPEIINRYAQANQNILVLGAHFNNWEWGSVGSCNYLDFKVYGLYKPVANTYINEYINAARMNVGTSMIPIKNTRTLFDGHLEPPSMIVFVADQSPSNMKEAIWLDFLGRDTACLHGPEKYAQQTEWPVVFFHIRRVKRGYYELDITELDHNAEESITSQYMALLEKDIKKSPSSWLWTHKRWKRRREESL